LLQFYILDIAEKFRQMRMLPEAMAVAGPQKTSMLRLQLQSHSSYRNETHVLFFVTLHPRGTSSSHIVAKGNRK